MADVVSGEAVILDVPTAGFPARIVALLLDLLVQGAAGLVLLLVILAAAPHLNVDVLVALIVAGSVLVVVGYPATFETLSRGRSLGKMAMGLRVVSDDGGPERFRQALVRALASIIEIWSLSGAPALICSMLSAKGKRLGDLFAGTFVIQERLPQRQVLPPWFAVVPPPLLGWAQMLQISGLDDSTAEQAASYLRRVWELAPAARQELGQRIAAAVAARVTPPPPPGTPPEAFLAAVLAVRRQREMTRMAAFQAAAAGPAQQPAYQAAPYPGPYPGAPNPGAPYPPAVQYPAVQSPPPAAPAAPGSPGSPSPADAPAPAPAAREEAGSGFAPPS